MERVGTSSRAPFPGLSLPGTWLEGINPNSYTAIHQGVAIEVDGPGVVILALTDVGQLNGDSGYDSLWESGPTNTGPWAAIPGSSLTGLVVQHVVTPVLFTAPDTWMRALLSPIGDDMDGFAGMVFARL